MGKEKRKIPRSFKYEFILDNSNHLCSDPSVHKNKEGCEKFFYHCSSSMIDAFKIVYFFMWTYSYGESLIWHQRGFDVFLLSVRSVRLWWGEMTHWRDTEFRSLVAYPVSILQLIQISAGFLWRLFLHFTQVLVENEKERLFEYKRNQKDSERY